MTSKSIANSQRAFQVEQIARFALLKVRASESFIQNIRRKETLSVTLNRETCTLHRNTFAYLKRFIPGRMNDLD